MGTFVNKLNNIYDNYNDATNTNFPESSIIKSYRNDMFLNEQSNTVVQQYSFQNLLRPLFNKKGIISPKIGNHPDFEYLQDTNEVAYSPITTLMMDIEGSTRLNLIFKPEEVQKIKNSIICATIELICSFDGHVHRIMGDAVMAFFGGKDKSTENSIIDAINCASLLQYFMEKVVRPRLDYDNPLGIRIGLDYGSKVLWSNYGYYNVNEVTATSINVDVTAKLQHQAGRNNILIGDALKKHIDFPSELLSYKQSGNQNDYMLRRT
ncbi:MAG TPA: adenylate/guanylate cyclase domain-containing protein [Ignavibacteriaceae bacterium]|nr:adenylate/guanylate cyclase domain-containing protein [Ignavibacteriaceae bacterium]